jgi:hypothetical protein
MNVLNPGNIRRMADSLLDLLELVTLFDVVKKEPPSDRRCCRGRFGSRGVSWWQRVCSRMASEES